jgi:hypothetical protein
MASFEIASGLAEIPKILSPAKTADFESNSTVRATANVSFPLPGNEEARRVRP